MRIVVVGAGLAGLRAAQLLIKDGHEVWVYEAQDRVGGRLWTRAIGDGIYEAGGEWIDSDHRRVLGLLDEFGLKPEPSDQWPGIVVLGGKRRSEDESDADVEKVNTEATKLAKKLAANAWESENAEELENQSLGDWLDGICETEDGRELVEMIQRSDEGEDTHQVGLLGWLVSYKNYLNREEGDMSSFRIPHGAGTLCDQIGRLIEGQVLMGKPLRSIDVIDDGIQCWFDGEMAFADHVVIAVPGSKLSEIEWPLDLPFEYFDAWQSLKMARAIKVVIEYESAWWESLDWKGRLMGKLECQQVWIGGREGAAALTCYICGDQADVVRRSSDPVRVCADSIAQVFSESGTVMGGELIDWVDNEWAGGAFPYLPSGAVLATEDWLSRSFGRIHFAGDHTSQWIGFMEGALESAERVVKEIKESGTE